MPERSFKKEVAALRRGSGEELHCEGILGVTKALLQSGVAYVGGYQGAPISHLMDVLGDAQDILEELDVHFESSGSEATAAAMLAASVNYPLRGAVTWKSTAGTNVASDALANLASSGVTGGALVIIGEDYGEGSSIMQERSHAFAMKSQIWLLDPRPNLPMITDMVETGFDLSEASNTPVMLELRIRACHLHGSFVTKDNQRPKMTVKQAKATPHRDTSRIVLPPSNFLHEKEKFEDRLPAAIQFIKERQLNEFFDGDSDDNDDDNNDDIGLILQGGLYNIVIRALSVLGLADSFGNCRLPIYVMNVTYPYIDEEILRFCADKKAVLMIEEGQPAYIEQAISHILRRAELPTKLYGKDIFPGYGEYEGDVIKTAVEKFILAAAPVLSEEMSQKVPQQPVLAGSPTTANEAPSVSIHEPAYDMIPATLLEGEIPPRPAGFCVGCPERPIFSAVKQVQQTIGDLHMSCDIGCHLFSILPPFDLGNTTMGYGLGAAGGSAFNVPSEHRNISVMGDGGFWHNGLTSSISNAVFNQSNDVVMIVDNSYSAATGGQDIMSSRATLGNRSTQNTIEKAVKGVGVTWVRQVDTYDVASMKKTLHEAMSSPEPGPKVIIAQNECMLNKQRREKPLVRAKIKSGKRHVRERFFVDTDTCTGDHACIRLSGCPSLTVKENPNPLKSDPVAWVDNDCEGCGLCGENAHTAVLCPSFARTDIIFNPNPWDRFIGGIRQAVIGFLQNRVDRRLEKYAL